MWTRSRQAAAARGSIPAPLHSAAEVTRSLAQRLASDAELWLAERSRGELLGMLVLAGEWLDQLYVDPARSGAGVGSQLLDCAKRERPQGLRLWTFESNVRARRFYERRGFVAVERTDGAGNEEHAPDVLYVWRPEASGADSRIDSRTVAPSDDDLFGAEHVRVYRDTGGERGYHWRGTTILLLTTRGRSSGESRTTPLIHRTDGDRWIVVASKGGAPHNPSWFENLTADPEAVIEVKDERIPVRATVAEGEERARLWSLMNEVWPAYDEYQTKTDRQIPVVVLTRR